MTAQAPSAVRPAVCGAAPHTQPGSIATVIWHRLALIAIAVLIILVILPALLSTAGTQFTAVT